MIIGTSRSWWTRLLCSLLLLLVVWYSIDFENAFERLQLADLPLLIASILVLLARTPLMVLRWQLILRQLGLRLSWRRGTYVTLLSIFLGQFSPSGIGSDLARGLMIGSSHGTGAVVSSLVTDRFYGIVSVILLALPPALIVVSGRMPVPPGLGWFVIAFSGVVLVFFVVLRVAFPGDAHALSSRATGVLGRSAAYASQFAASCSDPALAGRSIVLSLLIQIAAVLSVILIGAATGIDLPLWGYFLVVPLIWLIASLPISLGGIGIREASFVALLPAFGVARPEALTFGVMVSIISVTSALAGALFALMGRRLLKD